MAKGGILVFTMGQYKQRKPEEGMLNVPLIVWKAQWFPTTVIISKNFPIEEFIDKTDEIEEAIGYGSYGKVYKGRDRRTNQNYAIKVFRYGSAKDESALKEFHILKWLKRLDPNSRYSMRGTDTDIVLVNSLNCTTLSFPKIGSA